MKKSEIRKNLTDYLFANYPNEKGFWLSSDNQAFTDKHKGDGLNHAKTLQDKELVWEENPKIKPEDIDEDEELTEEELAEQQLRDGLFARYTDLFGKAPNKNIGTETLKTKIAEKEAESK